MANIVECPLPHRSALSGSYAHAGFADAFGIDLPHQATGDAALLAAHIFGGQAGWVGALLAVRDFMVAPFGLKTASVLRRDLTSDRIDIFRVFERHPREIILGEDDRHLDFRVSVLVDEEGASRRLVVTTLVFYRHWGGRAYIRAIAPFHRLVVKSALRGCERAGWPVDQNTATVTTTAQ